VRRSQRMSTLTELGWAGLGWDGGEERGGEHVARAHERLHAH
jgi:hypothetical protein